MSSEVIVRAENLGKCYQLYDQPRDRLLQMVSFGRRQYFKEFWALRGVSFEIRRGETVGIVGRNGSGKSTLLQLICGTLNPTTGTVLAEGRVAALLELGSGFNPEFTGRENVYMNATILGLKQGEIDTRYDEIAAFADIGPFMERPLKTYSSGMQVRLAFAVAVSVEPQILVVDEALSVGDERFQRKCFARIEAIKNAGATILFVSHSGGTVVDLCDRAMLLDAGEKLEVGPPKQVIGHYQKLIYANEERRHAVRESILALSALGRSRDSGGIGLEDLQEAVTAGESKATNDWYDPELRSQSTIEYESNGARIDSPRIETLSGEEVNCVRRGCSYRYVYRVEFTRTATNVRFGMMIKAMTGIELGGAVSAPTPERGLSTVPAGTVLWARFQFVCNVNPGTYFLNAGVTGAAGEEDKFLHRMLDLCMFKVVPVPLNTSTALVDFHCMAEIAHD